MIVLDTNVLSELLKPAPDPVVVNWVDAQETSELTITALTAAELRAGVALLPEGQRKQRLRRAIESLLTETFAGAILAFEAESAPHYAEIVASRTRTGRPISTVDAQIAAVSRQHEATLATRNTADFTETGVTLVDPSRAG